MVNFSEDVSIGEAVREISFNVSVLQRVIRGNFPATKRVSIGGHIVLRAHWTII